MDKLTNQMPTEDEVGPGDLTHMIIPISSDRGLCGTSQHTTKHATRNTQHTTCNTKHATRNTYKHTWSFLVRQTVACAVCIRCSVLQCIGVWGSVLQCVGSVVQHVAVCWSVEQRVAACWSMVQHVPVLCSVFRQQLMRYVYVAVCCSVLQLTIYYNCLSSSCSLQKRQTLTGTAACPNITFSEGYADWFPINTHCKTPRLQHTATILQHAAAHWCDDVIHK